MEDFRAMPVILHGLELLDVVVPDQGAREQRRELRVPQRVPDNLVLGMGCMITETDLKIYNGSCLHTLKNRRLHSSPPWFNRIMVKLGKYTFKYDRLFGH